MSRPDGQASENDPIAEQLESKIPPLNVVRKHMNKFRGFGYGSTPTGRPKSQASPPDLFSVFSFVDTTFKLNDQILSIVRSIDLSIEYYTDLLDEHPYKGKLEALIANTYDRDFLLSCIYNQDNEICLEMINEFGQGRRVKLTGVKFLKRVFDLKSSDLILEDVIHFAAKDMTEEVINLH